MHFGMRRTRNIRLLLAFDGSAYAGWQRQAAAPTVQGTVEEALTRLTGTPVTLHGAGRTDAGVHARGMVANGRSESSIPPNGLVRALNNMLPPDIRVLDADEAPPDFHSRFDALGKTYCYDLCLTPIQNPLQRLYCAHVPRPFQLEPVAACLDLLTGTHDFAAFEGSGSRDRTHSSGRGAIRTLREAQCFPLAGCPAHFRFRFTGDGFLRHMVRNLVGTLLEVAAGKYGPQEFQDILTSGDRGRAGPTAAARGLCLHRLYYDPPWPTGVCLATVACEEYSVGGREKKARPRACPDGSGTAAGEAGSGTELPARQESGMN